MQLIHAPQLNPNEDSIYVVEWKKRAREHVKRGDVIAEVETSKATVELEAEADGFLVPLVEAKKAVAVGHPLAALLASPDEEVVLPSSDSSEAREENQASSVNKRRWTAKARLLAQRHGLDPQTVEVPMQGTGTVTEAALQTFLQQHTMPMPTPMTALSTPTSLPTLQADLVDSQYPSGRTERILVLGGGDGAIQTLDVIRRVKHQRAVGILDDNTALHGRTILGCPVVGPLAIAQELWAQGVFDKAIISISTILKLRVDLFTQLASQGIPFANVVDPTVTVGSNVSMGRGNLIMAFSRLASCATIGNNNFLSAYVNIEHHAILGSHCTFGPGVMLSGWVRIGDRVRLGTGIFMEPGVTIEDDAVIGSGSILVYGSRIPKGSTVRTRSAHTAGGRHPA